MSNDILREVSSTDDDDFPKKLDFFHLHALEQEMKKIEAFKRELPHCMRLLKDAIEKLKEESPREVGPAEEGFTLFRNYVGDERAKSSSNNFGEKKNWMSSVQLFTPISTNQDSVFHLTSRFLEGDSNGSGSGNHFGSKFRNDGGAFLPFKKPAIAVNEKQGTAPVEGISLAVSDAEVASDDLTTKGDYGFVKSKPHQQEQQKKQRRCWSPELHKIFVDALHKLGGAQTATPKQIRELMKVEGLTNDEVKSHLQKYRIHIKRVQTASSGRSFAGSGSPQGPLHRVEEDDKSESHGWKTKLHI